MTMLAFDTCFGACSVMASWRATGASRGAADSGIAFRFERLARGHAERLVPMIGEVMSEAPFDFPDIRCLVVTTGPGTFTGQRVGIAAARALALATGAPVASLSSLAVMAYTAASELGPELTDATLAIAVDARRGEIYFQRFAGSDLTPAGDPVLASPEAAAGLLGDGHTIAAGSGAAALADAARRAGGSVTARLPDLEPDIRFVPEAAVVVGAGLPRPLYLRPPDAKPQGGAVARSAS
jgi:tRNA threonylcarbamoyladenosine biosynthesis protein TsaB